MVSAVHPGSALEFYPAANVLQRGCTWLVQFIRFRHQSK